MKSALRNYALVTGAYWGFTLTDGALRMLVLLHFDRLGYIVVTTSILSLIAMYFVQKSVATQAGKQPV